MNAPNVFLGQDARRYIASLLRQAADDKCESLDTPPDDLTEEAEADLLNEIDYIDSLVAHLEGVQ